MIYLIKPGDALKTESEAEAKTLEAFFDFKRCTRWRYNRQADSLIQQRNAEIDALSVALREAQHTTHTAHAPPSIDAGVMGREEGTRS